MRNKILVGVFTVFVCTVNANRNPLPSIESASFGFEGFNCVGPNGNGKVLFPCDEDCKEQHNAEYGYCGNPNNNDFSCYCGPPKLIISKESRQCENIVAKEKFDTICHMDCLCNHAALDAKCNYETKACECIGQAKNMSQCPYKSMDEMINAYMKFQSGFHVVMQALQFFGAYF